MAGLVGRISSTAVLILLAGAFAAGQSVADAARKNQANKQKDPAKPAAKKVYTDEDMPSAGASASASPAPAATSQPAAAGGGSGDTKWTAEQWRAAIGAMKDRIASFQAQLDEAQRNQIAYANNGDYCYINGKLVSCVEFNEALKRNQVQLERGRRQLEEAKQKLADLQERCRKAGFGSSVYD